MCTCRAGIEDFTATTSTADIESFSPTKYAQAGAGDSFQPKLPSAEASSGALPCFKDDCN